MIKKINNDLTAEQKLVEKWQQTLNQFEGFKIGIAWQGSKDFGNDTFARLSALADLSGIFYNYTNTTQCFNLSTTVNLGDDNYNAPNNSNPDWVGLAWNYLYVRLYLIYVYFRN